MQYPEPDLTKVQQTQNVTNNDPLVQPAVSASEFPEVDVAKTQEMMMRLLGAAQRSRGNLNTTARQQRRQAARDQIKFQKKRVKKISRLEPRYQEMITKLATMAKECKTHGQLFFINMCDEVLINFNDAAKEEIAHCVTGLIEHGLEIANSPGYKDIFDNYNAKIKQLDMDKLQETLGRK